MLNITDITIDYMKNPIGITKRPQFGWVMLSDERDVKQYAYELQIAQDISFTKLLYTSGWVISEESAHVYTENWNMESLKKYCVRVRVRNQREECSEWSESAFFITALIENRWTGVFISAETQQDANKSNATYLRKEFSVKNRIKCAYLCSTALGLYQVFLNGKKVGTDELTPGWTSYKKHLRYQTYDVTHLLQEGSNAIGAAIGAGWYKGKMGFVGTRNNYGMQTAFLAQLVVEYKDGSTQTIATDTSWTGNDSPIVFSEIYDGEIYDANLEIEGWNLPELQDDTWHIAEEVPYDFSVLEAQAGAKVAEIESVPAKNIFVTPQGDTVIDFGQNLSGWIHISAMGKTGDKIELNCFEVLDAEGNVYIDNLRGAKQTLLYIFGKTGEITYHPHFTFQGFRYAKISSYPGLPAIEHFTAYAVHSNMKETGQFSCSNQEVNQLQHNILWGMKGNFVDVPTDCPQRNERLGWTGDAQIFCRTASYLMNTYQFYKKWLQDVKADQTPEGGIPHVVPDILTGRTAQDWLLSKGTHSAAAWADVAVIMPWVLYQTYGDKEILKVQYESMKGWVDFMRTHAKDYIWNYKVQFGDWVALDAEEGSYFGATPNDLTCTAYFAYTTKLFVQICKVLKKKKEVTDYQNLYDNIEQAYQTRFFDETGNLTTQTQTAHIISLYFGLTPERYRLNVVEGLKRLLKKEGGHLVTGFVGTPYFCHALSENGCTKEAYDLLLKDDFPSWLYQVKKGATTIWEHWDGIKPDGTMWSPDMNSFNHYAYGAIGEWLYRVCAGIEIDNENPGYKHILFRPHIGGFSYVNATFESIYGEIQSAWKVEKNHITVSVRVPVNTTGDLFLENAATILQADGLIFEAAENGQTAQMGSGSYTICYQEKEK